MQLWHKKKAVVSYYAYQTHAKTEQFFADFTRIVPDHFLVERVANIYTFLFAKKSYVALYLSWTK